jgi:hypothetical protein
MSMKVRVLGLILSLNIQLSVAQAFGRLCKFLGFPYPPPLQGLQDVVALTPRPSFVSNSSLLTTLGKPWADFDPAKQLSDSLKWNLSPMLLLVCQAKA